MADLPEFECAYCDGGESADRHHPACIVAIEQAEDARIERLIDRVRGL